MTNGSLMNFRNQIKQNNQEEYEIACQSYMNYDEEAEIEEAIRNGDFDTTHPVMKRVAEEQSQNISVMFKKIKHMEEKK